IASGDYDQYLRSAAQQAVAWHGPIMVRFAHEMNLPGSPFGPGQNGNTPANFIAAWRHVVTVFRQTGATNVSWVWSPNVDCGGDCPFRAFYPGDQWVDWVGLDGYNYASVDNVPWMTFEQIFGTSYNELTALTSKPLMVAETASTELGGSKATWIQQAFAGIPTSMPDVQAVVWFDIDKETDWRVNSSPSSLTAYRQVVDSPTYSGRVVPVP
ncbi:MAG TPA: glycosyl hydrolase, partial [Acidimicrobiales bacterium]|nr:glycosyl hydrolase [Acidimicrobiales bacterium]